MTSRSTEPIDRGAGGPGWEEVRHSKATGWDSAGRAKWLTVKPWYWRFMVFAIAYEMRGTLRNTMFGPTHGEATSVPSNRTVILWPKPAHLLVRWSMHPATRLARELHRALNAAGHYDDEALECRHPFMRWYYWLADNIWECQWIRESPTITVSHA